MSEENLFNLFVFHLPEHVSVEGVSGEIQFPNRSILEGKLLVCSADVKVCEVGNENVSCFSLAQFRNMTISLKCGSFFVVGTAWNRIVADSKIDNIVGVEVLRMKFKPTPLGGPG